MGDENKNIPDWKADFPISKTEAGYVARRDFLKVDYPFLRYYGGSKRIYSCVQLFS